MTATAISRTIPAIQNRLTWNELPKILTMSDGRTPGIRSAAEPNHSSMVAWSTSRIPTEATSFASVDDVRNGRNTSTSLSTPTSTAAASAMMIATAVGGAQPKKYSPLSWVNI